MKTLVPALSLIFTLACSACNDLASRSSDIGGPKGTEYVPTVSTAYVTDLGDLNVVTKFRDRKNNPLEAPSTYSQSGIARLDDFASSIRVDFGDDDVTGHGDLNQPVYCLLIDVRREKTYYGMYALSGLKMNLVMPLPTSESTIRPEDTTAAESLVNLITSLGLSSERSNEIVNDQGEVWFRLGLRAFLFTKIPVFENGKPTVLCFECLADSI